METSCHSVLLGDPRAFRIRGGGNPHTRTRWGCRKRVDRERAVSQWVTLARTLTQYGLHVYVLPPDPACPGLVFPANAGFLAGRDDARPLAAKRFYLSSLLPTRAAEAAAYARFLTQLGCSTEPVPYRFEGEADFFPVGSMFLFTHGPVVRQGVVPRWGWPPYTRRYGFRSDQRMQPFLEALVSPARVLTLTLVDEAYYHGDTVLCAVGPRRERLLAYRPGLDPASWRLLEDTFQEGLIPLSEEDGRAYVANAFQFTAAGRTYLLVPPGITRRLWDTLLGLDVLPIVVNVSEFFEKGGGSIKCLIGDLGGLDDADPGLTAAHRAFRDRHRFRDAAPDER